MNAPKVTHDIVPPTTNAQPWMRTALLLAAGYNIVWGAIAIVAPLAIFRITGAKPLPAYPELWQCIGMIVGVYGVGYAIAARAPFIHWPIVLVGLLGKILGPVGFLLSMSSGRLPAKLGWTILTNDLIWWIPFTLILWHAARFHQSRREEITVRTPTRKIDPLGRMVSQRGATLIELSRRKPVLVVFLRHSGCTFCREAVSDISAVRQQIEGAGTQIAFVHMGQQEPVELMERYRLTDVHSFRDPTCSLYDTFGLKLGSFNELLGPRVWWRGTLAWMSGHTSGGFDGNVFRMPGVFLMHNGEVVRGFRHRSAAERPDYVRLSTLPDAAEPPRCETSDGVTVSIP
ncbi:SelL-related redox protein [Fuerstiella marisgermanici]|uniref:AhpC/TSA family protein n=1 Tax=Fuerstiella marisgermanici TaxID=1891926 RepID=A0A1P8WA40_9PLAN|nr:SelL-related redox protein [Fuerstiella marisgermanici]APZ90910.1 hypothetical protein Fuma_00494 [Fuerstiella marisgermanici]